MFKKIIFIFLFDYEFVFDKFFPILFITLIGVTIGLIGVIITIGYENLSGIVSTEIGKFFIILSSVSYAFAAIFAKIKLNKVDPSLAATGMLTTSTIILTPIMFFIFDNSIIVSIVISTIDLPGILYIIIGILVLSAIILKCSYNPDCVGLL